jgi:ATP-dependent RNA/DNA helicase IGHMBP2
MPSFPHFDRLKRALVLEAEAEARLLAQRARTRTGPAAEQSGDCLLRLAIVEERPGLGGRVSLTLTKRDRTQSLPWNRLAVGTPVLLTEEGSSRGDNWRAVVSRRDRESIDIALADSPETESDRPTFRLDLSSDQISRERQLAALAEGARADRGRLAQLRDVLLGQRQPQFDPPRPWQPLDTGLNDSQRAAVELALAARDVGIVHGPPGTGKTRTVTELIRQAVARGEKVLACAPSNLAVDNLLERLVAPGERAIRLGHPARVLPELQQHTLDVLVDRHPDVALARRLVKEAGALRDRAARFTRAKPPPGARQALRQEARELLADAQRIEDQLVAHLLDSAAVVCCTLTGIDSRILGDRQFDLVVIDEAAQAVEPACWIPLLRGSRLVLAGDHCQLPPTIVSPEAAREGLGVTLMERLIMPQAAPLARRLTVQYRMHEAIMAFSSTEFYDSGLVADASVAGHVLADLPGVERSPLTETPLQLIDTAGASYDEETEDEGTSLFNRQEAELACRKVEQLLAAGVAAGDIALIAPYAAQVQLLRSLLQVGGLEIDTVDGFQGREKEAVVISLVRSNERGEIGFLADTRRMNVALTRARRKLIVLGDSGTLACHPFYERLLGHFEACGAHHSVWEEAN